MANSAEQPKKGHTGLIILALFVIIAAAAGLFVYSKYTGIRDYNEALDPSDTEPRVFEIARGEGYNTIGRHLQEAGLIKDAELFANKTKILKLGPKYQAGTFLLSPSMTMDEIMKALQDGRRNTVRFTIPEGYTLAQAAQKLAAEGFVDEQKFYKALEDYDTESYWFLKDLEADQPDPTGAASPEANKFEGFLFPDTYEIYEGSTEKMILDKLFGQFGKVFDKEMQDRMKERGQTVKEIITIASIIEREAREDEERPLVASVIYNRLDLDMALGMDTTVLFILGEHRTEVTYEETEIDSPYNTYLYTGLPLGPISSPGLPSIEAALYPAETDLLYFVVSDKGDGSLAFSNNYEDFRSATDAYNAYVEGSNNG